MASLSPRKLSFALAVAGGVTSAGAAENNISIVDVPLNDMDAIVIEDAPEVYRRILTCARKLVEDHIDIPGSAARFKKYNGKYIYDRTRRAVWEKDGAAKSVVFINGKPVSFAGGKHDISFSVSIPAETTDGEIPGREKVMLSVTHDGSYSPVIDRARARFLHDFNKDGSTAYRDEWIATDGAPHMEISEFAARTHNHGDWVTDMAWANIAFSKCVNTQGESKITYDTKPAPYEPATISLEDWTPALVK